MRERYWLKLVSIAVVDEVVLVNNYNAGYQCVI